VDYVIPNLSKAVQMLKVLASSEAGMSAQEIEKTLEIPRTTAFRILKTLIHEGMVYKEGTVFGAGAGLFEIGLNALSRSPIRERAVPLLQELTRATGQTSHLAVPSGWHSLILEVCDSTSPVRVASRPGTLAELHCSATGKIFLSYLYPDRLAEYLAASLRVKRTPNTCVEPEALKSMAEQVRSAGYAVDEEEYHPGVRCLAAPVFNMRGEAAAAIGVTGPTVSFTKEDIPFVREQVCKAAETLSASLGCKK
jgi:DNA-binding IclR family transcriptional regulator